MAYPLRLLARQEGHLVKLENIVKLANIARLVNHETRRTRAPLLVMALYLWAVLGQFLVAVFVLE